LWTTTTCSRLSLVSRRLTRNSICRTPIKCSRYAVLLHYDFRQYSSSKTFSTKQLRSRTI
jgi:hypothetical protein